MTVAGAGRRGVYGDARVEMADGRGKRWMSCGQAPKVAVESRAQTPEVIAKALLERCEGTVASLAAQLALMVSEDFVPCENLARNRMLDGVRRTRRVSMGGMGAETGGRGIDAGRGRSSA